MEGALFEEPEQPAARRSPSTAIDKRFI